MTDTLHIYQPSITSNGNSSLVELIDCYSNNLSSLNMAAATQNYQPELIERELMKIQDVEKAKKVVKIILAIWDLDIIAQRDGVVKYDPESSGYVPYITDLPERLQQIINRMILRQQREDELAALARSWQENSTSSPQFQDDNKVITAPPCHAGEEAENEEEPEYHMADLPEEEFKHVLLKNDRQYSCLVHDLCGPVKKWVDEHNLMDWNVVRFTLAKHYIIARKTSVRVFNNIISHIIPNYNGNHEIIKKRQDANHKNWETYEDDYKYWKLKKDVKKVEECLANTIEMLA